ncbi:MAG: hypothetical protein HXS52_12405 [Theionarchaea archaeon]|nr:hypothetical protein [Theionarchaea archaeon]MBU7038725.1 hypothetical protein [Theionarchaea archaeon]
MNTETCTMDCVKLFAHEFMKRHYPSRVNLKICKSTKAILDNTYRDVYDSTQQP